MHRNMVVLLALATLTTASSPSRTAPPFTTRGAFFALSIADLAASERWYTEKLGLAVLQRFPSTAKANGILLGGNGLEVELISHGDATDARGGDAVLTHGFFKSGFRVDRFDATVAELRARGVQFAYGPYPARKDQRANVIIRDNAGNLIQIFGDYAP